MEKMLVTLSFLELLVVGKLAFVSEGDVGDIKSIDELVI